MRRSTDRILTTHAGSLARPPELVRLLSDRVEGRQVAGAEFRAAVRAAIEGAVGRQVGAGIDVVSDGEMGKPGFANYVMERMTGFANYVMERMTGFGGAD